MRAIQDEKHCWIVQVRFTIDEYTKIVSEGTRTGRLTLDVMHEVLAWGLENYPYTKQDKASYGE